MYLLLSYLPSTQNNPYDKVACFGVKYSATLKQTFVVLPFVMVNSGSQNMVSGLAASASPGNLLEIQILKPHPRLQFSSVAQSCPTLCDPMDCSIPGFPVHHQLLKLAQTHVHQVGNAIQPSHLLSSPSPPAFNLSQHQGLFQ